MLKPYYHFRLVLLAWFTLKVRSYRKKFFSLNEWTTKLVKQWSTLKQFVLSGQPRFVWWKCLRRFIRFHHPIFRCIIYTININWQQKEYDKWNVMECFLPESIDILFYFLISDFRKMLKHWRKNWRYQNMDHTIYVRICEIISYNFILSILKTNEFSNYFFIKA